MPVLPRGKKKSVAQRNVLVIRNQREIVFAVADKPIVLHSGKFHAHRTALDRKIVGELLVVEGNRKMLRAAKPRLLGKTGEQFVARGAEGKIVHFFVQIEISSS